MKKVFRDSFKRWAQATTGVLRLTETTYDNADIKVGGHTPQRCHFRSLPSEKESLSWENGVLDLESAAMHLLGLDHSNKEDSVMYPNVLPWQQRKVELSVSDMENIQRHYTNGISGHSGRWGVLLITILSLGFAYELL
ncbi:metalloendoproteinase 2-MMP-like [Glycine soja]|uniref:metalloendoproteinase 2-MMP-like n=1 Tax=Glycine soja TaxID=3848 RepID=UPI00103E1CCF|nr:metalloendoproteinase 2-MMP-like [Glycine soja]